MVIGCPCFDLQRTEDGENDLKSSNDARKAASLAVSETIKEDQPTRSKDVTTPDQSADTSSDETKASEKLPSAVAPMTVTSKVQKTGRRVYLGRRVVDLWSLMKHSHRHISQKRYSTEVKRSFPGTSTEIRDTDRGIPIKTRRSFRMKRVVAPSGSWSRANRSFKIFAIWGQRGFHAQNDICVEKEKELIRSLATSGTVSTEVLNGYKEEKTKQRKLVYDSIKERPYFASRLEEGYKVMIEDSINDYEYDDFGIRTGNAAFFETPSPALTKYKAMKQKEYDTIDSYLQGSGSGDIYEGQTGNEFEGGAIDNSARADFECPKKKRESGSVASKMYSQVLMIFSCMIIGSIIVGLQGLEFSEDDLNANKNARKVQRGFL